ncbi:hypothetical protein [Agromyces bauzanensis]
MPRTTRLDRPTPSARAVRRWRIALAGLLAAGMAVIGLAFAAPANAKTGFPDLELLSTSDCDYGNSGTATFLASDLLPSNTYKLTISTVAGEVQLEDSLPENVHDWSATFSLDPGEYRAALFEQLNDAEWALADETTFMIGACLDLDVAIIDATCSHGDDGVMTLVLSGLVMEEEYRWEAAGFQGQFVADAETVQIPLASGTPPGNYLAYAETVGESPVFDWRAFAIEPCQPDLTVTVTQCTVAGGTGTVDVALADLVHGVAYTVTGPDGSTQQATAQQSGVTNLTFPSIAGGTVSTVTVEGTWTVDEPYEEPPYIGGGDFVPLDTVSLTASAGVTLEPCPAVVPAGGKAPALPATGTGDPMGPMAAALALLALGGAAVAIGRRRSAPTEC